MQFNNFPMIFIWLSWVSCRDTTEANHIIQETKMTQRTAQLTQHGSALVIWLVALNIIYTFFSTFEKALVKSWNDKHFQKKS